MNNNVSPMGSPSMSSQDFDAISSQSSSKRSAKNSIFSGKRSSVSQKVSVQAFNLEKTKSLPPCMCPPIRKNREENARGLGIAGEEKFEAIVINRVLTDEQKIRVNRFTFCKELSDKFFAITTLYVASLISLEKIKLQHQTKSIPNSQQAVDEGIKQSANLLTELSFVYSEILMNYRFPGDAIKEKLFFETLYKLTVKIILFQYDNTKLHSIIERELLRLFRSEHFNEKHSIPVLDAKQLYTLKKELGTIPENFRRKVERKASVASNLKSPLITSMFPSFDKWKNTSTRGFEAIQLEIPLEILVGTVNPAPPTTVSNSQNSKEEDNSILGRK